MSRPVKVKVRPGAIVYLSAGEEEHPRAHGEGEDLELSPEDAKTLESDGLVERA